MTTQDNEIATKTRKIQRPATPKVTDLGYDWLGLEECLASSCPVTGVAFDYTEGTLIPRHSHPKAQLIYAVTGTMTVTTTEGTWVLLPARAVWVPAGTEHSIQVKTSIRMRTLYFGPQVRDVPKECAVVGISSFFRGLILELLNESRSYGKEERGDHLAALICDELRTVPVLPLHLPWPKDARLRHVCKSLRAKPTLHRSIDVWADEAGMSRRTLERYFQKELGMTFFEWRTHLLLLEAQTRLAQGHSSARIARALGYDSHSAFIAMFRRYLGTTPSLYFREQNIDDRNGVFRNA